MVFRTEQRAFSTDGKCDSLGQCVWVWCPLLVFLVMSHLVGETLREGIYNNGVLSEEWSLGR